VAQGKGELGREGAHTSIHVWGVGDTYACVWYHIFSPNNGSPNDGSPNNVSPNNVSPNNVSPNDIFP
jgi:hypothetical protein